MSYGHLRNGIIHFAGSNSPGWMSNLALSLDAGRLKLVSNDGRPLSTRNPGWVTVPSVTPGRLATLKVTSSVYMDDDTATVSMTHNLGWGVVETVDWALNAPFYIHVVNRGDADITGIDGDSAICMARAPILPGNATPSDPDNIGDAASIPVNDGESVILLWGTYTKANYTSLTMTSIGYVPMQWSTSTDDWTVQLFDNALGTEALLRSASVLWNFPKKQNGADTVTQTHMIPNGGTAPVFTSTEYLYSVDPFTGKVFLQIYLDGDPGTGDGATAVDAKISLPYKAPSSITDNRFGPCYVANQGKGAIFGIFVAPGDETYARILHHTISGSAIQNGAEYAQNSHFSNGARSIMGGGTYKPFPNF